MVCVAWFIGWVALAPQVPAAHADARVVPAVEWLCERVDEVARKDEPLVGLSPAIVALALASAGRSEPMRRLQDALQRKADQVVSTPARALALMALAIDPPGDRGIWQPRSATLNRWLGDLVACQDLREWRSRRTLLGRRAATRESNATYGGFGLNLRQQHQREYDGRANVLSTALAALALRSVERIGFEILPSASGRDAEACAETWPAIAQFTLETRNRDGSLPWVPGSASGNPAATALGALTLSLARTSVALLPEDDARLAAQARIATAFDELLKLPIAPAPAPSRPPDGRPALSRLVLVASRARVSWSCASRDCEVHLDELELFHGADGGFDAALDLDGLNLPDDVVAFYESEQVRRILATSLAVLALTESLQRLDAWDGNALFRKVLPARITAERRRIQSDLVASDGMASMVALVNSLGDGKEWPYAFVRACIEAKTGWNLGLGAPPEPRLQSRVIERLRTWLELDFACDPGRQNAGGRVSKGVRCLLGDEDDTEVFGLRELYRALPSDVAVEEVVPLLRAPDPATRRAAARFVASLGVDVSSFDAEADPASMSANVEAIERELRRGAK